MSVGYSLRIVELNRSAGEELLGVKLGRVCIRNNMPVSVLAARLGVSRQTAYNWFVGVSKPSPSTKIKIEALLTTLR